MAHRIVIDDKLEYVLSNDIDINRFTDWLEQEADSVTDLRESDKLSEGDIVLDYEGGEAFNKKLAEDEDLELELGKEENSENESS